MGCGTVVEENAIVNEVTFGETSTGAAMVQGAYVGQGASAYSFSGHGAESDGHSSSCSYGRAFRQPWKQRISRADYRKW